jgi:hypothetical protein
MNNSILKKSIRKKEDIRIDKLTEVQGIELRRQLTSKVVIINTCMLNVQIARVCVCVCFLTKSIRKKKE